MVLGWEVGEPLRDGSSTRWREVWRRVWTPASFSLSFFPSLMKWAVFLCHVFPNMMFCLGTDSNSVKPTKTSKTVSPSHPLLFMSWISQVIFLVESANIENSTKKWGSYWEDAEGHLWGWFAGRVWKSVAEWARESPWCYRWDWTSDADGGSDDQMLVGMQTIKAVITNVQMEMSFHGKLNQSLPIFTTAKTPSLKMKDWFICHWKFQGIRVLMLQHG